MCSDCPTCILHTTAYTHARMLMYVEIYTGFSTSHNCLTSCTNTFTTTFTKLTFLNTHRFLIPYIMKHITSINIVTLFFFQDLKIPSFLDLRILIHLDFIASWLLFSLLQNFLLKKKKSTCIRIPWPLFLLLDPHNLLVNLINFNDICMLFISYFLFLHFALKFYIQSRP